VKILQPQVKNAEFARTVYVVSADHGSSPSDFLKPEAWVHVAKQFRPGDHIEVASESGAWFMELYVRSATATDVTVTALRTVMLDNPPADTEASGYDIGYAKGDKWRIVRKADKTVVASGMASRADCESWVSKQSEPALV
jgi:hypothetical protein